MKIFKAIREKEGKKLLTLKEKKMKECPKDDSCFAFETMEEFNQAFAICLLSIQRHLLRFQCTPPGPKLLF